ncbi:hypothetical protein M885DRAFT_552624 [Pelagophyceae sp. CCMP2097]|nr:hypothetical protein M885DRAFT_552624 [Pelagophyceae sp. CCMP2097]
MQKDGQPLTLGLISRTLGISDPEQLVELRALHLDGARIDRIRDLDAFAGTLRELHLRGNLLGALDADALAAVAPSLVVLALARNALATIDGAGLADFGALRVLDVSCNALRRPPAVEALPRTLTVLDLRGNACAEESEAPEYRAALSLRAPGLEELNGSRFAHAAAAPGAAPRTRAVASAQAFGAARAAASARAERVVYVPLVGDRAGEAPRRTVALRFSAGDDVSAVAADFVRDHGVDGPGAAEAISAIMTAALEAARPLDDAPARRPEPAKQKPRRGNDGDERKGQTEAEAHVEETYEALRAVSGDVEADLKDSRGRTNDAFAAKREAMRRRADERLQAAAQRSQEAVEASHKLRVAHDDALRAQRRDFADGVRARLNQEAEAKVDSDFQGSPKADAHLTRAIAGSGRPPPGKPFQDDAFDFQVDEIERPLYGDDSDSDSGRGP